MKEIDADMIESIEMWLHEIEPKWVEKELNWLEELRSRLLESEIPNDLEEAAEKEYPCDKSWMTPDMLDLNAHKQVAFRKGAKWQKEQMLKDAVEGEIQMRYSGCLCAKTIRAINEDKFKLGDKVHIIIVKEDEK